jgi:hypothetical protein
VHYDYIVEGLHAELATSLQAAVGLLGTDQTVVTSFASTLVALPNMKATGLSLVDFSSLKSYNRVVLQVPNAMIMPMGDERYDSSGICYTKISGSARRSCSNIQDIYLGERSFDIAAFSPDATATCGDLCTESYDQGCRGFEIRTAANEVIYCIIYSGRCVLDNGEETTIRGQYSYSNGKGVAPGPHYLIIACGGIAAVALASLIYMWWMKKPNRPAFGQGAAPASSSLMCTCRGREVDLTYTPIDESNDEEYAPASTSAPRIE